MKPYQHHDPVLDKGKAIPHPKRSTHATYFIRGRHGSWTRAEIAKAKSKLQKQKAKKQKTNVANIHVGVFAMIAMLLGFKSRR